MIRKFCGRKMITIPVSEKTFLESPSKIIEHYLGKCLSLNEKNKKDYKILNEYYCGVQDILKKQRLNGDCENNNILLANHIFRQVEFKKGFMVGNPISYSLAVSDKSTEDLTLLQRYLKDSNKSSKDTDKYESLYICGMAVQHIIPRKNDYDKKNEAPFELTNVEVGNAFKVYSSDSTRKPLFDVVINEYADEDFNVKKSYDVYFVIPTMNDGYCVCQTYDENFKEVGKPEKEPHKFLPLIEYSLNKNRLGIIELVITIQNGVNIILSNEVDEIADFVNSYFVFENQDLGNDWEDKINKFRANRAILLKTKNPELPAKLSLLEQAMQNGEINTALQIVIDMMYDIVACPKTSGGVTSGGDTGQARILGNGWESAQNQAQVDVSYVLQYERELLRKILLVCKEQNILNDLFVGDIDIKYSINMSNNMLTKTQSLQNLYAMHIPYEDALTITNITSDTHGLAEKWAKNDEEQKTIAMKMQTKNLGENQNNNQDSNSTNNGSEQ